MNEMKGKSASVTMRYFSEIWDDDNDMWYERKYKQNKSLVLILNKNVVQVIFDHVSRYDSVTNDEWTRPKTVQFTFCNLDGLKGFCLTLLQPSSERTSVLG